MEEFDQIIGQYSTSLYAYLLTHTRNHHTAEDLLQDALLKAYLAIEESQPANIEAWLMTIAKYTMYDYLNKQRRIQLEEADFFEKHLFVEKTSQLVTEDELQQALRLLKKLPAKQQKAIALIKLKEFSYEEVSLMLKMPINTLKSHVRRGQDKLRQLKEEENHHGKK